jgi:hypothetical protein
LQWRSPRNAAEKGYEFSPLHVMPPENASRAMCGAYHFVTRRPIRNVALRPTIDYGAMSESGKNGLGVRHWQRLLSPQHRTFGVATKLRCLLLCKVKMSFGSF